MIEHTIPQSGADREDQLIMQLKSGPTYAALTPKAKRLARRIVKERWRGDSYSRIQHLEAHRYNLDYLKTFSKMWPLTDFVEVDMRLVGRKLPEQWRIRRPKHFMKGEVLPSPGQP
jgi:hypothetical protein